uniref:Uncharacterized protein n=1 Tax=Molossus molossus TaxID=27622 RepID=A0A7J8I8N6_MOLMO|nr:hypothetical protein HJG59_010499 [Molossus molossus]
MSDFMTHIFQILFYVCVYVTAGELARLGSSVLCRHRELGSNPSSVVQPAECGALGLTEQPCPVSAQPGSQGALPPSGLRPPGPTSGLPRKEGALPRTKLVAAHGLGSQEAGSAMSLDEKIY